MIDVRDKSIYLSGPMSDTDTCHYEDFNRAAFIEAEEALYALGARYVFNPNEEVRNHAGDVLPKYLDRTECMRHDLHKLTTLNMFDMLVMLDGTEDSVGALVEAEVASQCGIQTAFLHSIVADKGRDTPKQDNPTHTEPLMPRVMRRLRKALNA